MQSEAEVIQEANERLLEQRKALRHTQTGNLTPLTMTSTQTILEIKSKGEDFPVCKECGQGLYRVYSDREGKLVWVCNGVECRKKREDIRQQIYLKEKQDHPERFMANYNIPKKHLSCSFETFKGNPKVVKICKGYSLQPAGSILFTGVCGSGKTHLAVSILREMVRHNKISKALFITTPELLLEIRQSFSDSDGYHEADLIDKYASIEFLILDDMGAEKATEWAITTLYLIIDRRNREERRTILTTNLSLPEIEQQLSTRIASRLADCRVIRLNMLDYRKKR